jgi:hypothetical protein
VIARSLAEYPWLECGVVGDHKSKCAYGKFKNFSDELSQLNGLSPLAG